MSEVCSGECLRGDDIGIPSGEIAYPHPDCPLHGYLWTPYDNEWSRIYQATHPERFNIERVHSEAIEFLSSPLASCEACGQGIHEHTWLDMDPNGYIVQCSNKVYRAGAGK